MRASSVSPMNALWLLSALILATSCGGGSNSGSARAASLPAAGLLFVSTPPTSANEGDGYSYPLQANVAGATLALSSAPSGAILSGSTVQWTPTPQQSRRSNQFIVTASYAGTTATQSWSVTPSGMIRGTTVDTCISDSGQATTINYVSGYDVTMQAAVPNVSGGFDVYSGRVANDGTFNISKVPAGSFWLLMPATGVWTSSSSVNMGHRYWGNCHREPLSSPGTSLTVAVSGLDPWQYYDYFDFVVPNAASGAGASPWPSVGDTSASVNIPYGNLLLLNAANGDNGYFAQLVTANYGGIEFHALKKFAGPVPITIQDGAVNSMTVALQPVPQTRTFRANIRGSAFAALYGDMSPLATGVAPGYNIEVGLSVDPSGPHSLGMMLLEASQSFTTDTDLGDVAFANPYPAAWTPYVDYSDFAMVSVNPAGATSPLQLPLMNRVVSAAFPTATSPIAPLIGPALNPKINGVSLFKDQVISGTAPTLSWDPPALGTASGYSISIYRIVVDGAGKPSIDYRGVLFTTSTPGPLPPGVLISGSSYLLVIGSRYRKGDLNADPHLETFPEGESDLGSGIITVP